jgi:hypothetical protein
MLALLRVAFKFCAMVTSSSTFLCTFLNRTADAVGFGANAYLKELRLLLCPGDIF